MFSHEEGVVSAISTSDNALTGDGDIATIQIEVPEGTTVGAYPVTVDKVRVNGMELVTTAMFYVNVVNNHTVVLDEASTTAPEAATGVDVRVKRTIRADEWSTICLPFAMTEAQVKSAFGDEAQLADFTGYEVTEDDDENIVGIVVNFDDVDISEGLEANHPYIIKVATDVSEFAVDGVDIVPDEDKIVLGYLVQSGDEKKQMPVCLNKRDLDKHTFVSGVTGSGKTTTCQNILLDCDLPFLVIEPAKTEYRSLLKKCPDLLFFTPGLPDVAPFFLNPFELFPGEKITSRADMLKATFEASFAMEAAIPQIMEAAIYRAYENKGWHIGTNLWHGIGAEDMEKGPFADGVYAFPTLSDMVVAVKEITEKQGFDERLKNDYLGSINARLEGLLAGGRGL